MDAVPVTINLCDQHLSCRKGVRSRYLAVARSIIDKEAAQKQHSPGLPDADDPLVKLDPWSHPAPSHVSTQPISGAPDKHECVVPFWSAHPWSSSSSAESAKDSGERWPSFAEALAQDNLAEEKVMSHVEVRAELPDIKLLLNDRWVVSNLCSELR